MSEPLTISGSVSSAAQTLSWGAIAAFMSGLPAEVVLGAFAGAVIFVTSATEYKIKRRLLMSLISFLSGLLAFKPTAAILIAAASVVPGITSQSFERGSVDAAGAFVVAIAAVKIGTWIYRRADNPGQLIRGSKDDDNS